MVRLAFRQYACCTLALAQLIGCRPETEGRPSLIDSVRVLAIRSEPAEASPGDSVSYEALVASPHSTESQNAKLSWSGCLLRKPLSLTGAVNPDCLRLQDNEKSFLGAGTQATNVIAAEACRIFGPNPPSPEPGAKALRAADPDTTGGYYQPVLLEATLGKAKEHSVGVTRLACGIGAATQEEVAEYNQRYHRNTNPTIESIYLIVNRKKQSVDLLNRTSPIEVPPGSAVQFEVMWPRCSSVEDCEPGTSGAERYLSFEPDARKLVERDEQLRVSWFATAGEFEHDRTGVGAVPKARASSNHWYAPEKDDNVSFWVVMRDDRRGVTWAQFQLHVRKATQHE